MAEWPADPTAEWIKLGFEEVVLSEFSFLIAEYSLACVYSDPRMVRYEGKKVAVIVALDPASFEVSVDITRLPPAPAESFSIWELARLLKMPGVMEASSIQASTSERLKPAVAQLAQLFRECAPAVVHGADAVFLELRALQAGESEEFLKRGRLAWTRGELGPAWTKRDYARVVRLLEPVADGLTSSERLKLEYARKQLPAPD